MSERMTAEAFQRVQKRRKVDREGPVHIEIVDWLRAHVPNVIVHHCRNEINKRGKMIAKELAAAARKGAVKGFPDLIVLPFAHCHSPVFFEVKAEGNYADATQKALHEDLRRMGYRVAVVRSTEDVRESLREWGIWCEVTP